MPIDITKLSPQAKLHYISLGKRYGSNATLAQADVSLNALVTHGDALIAFGFAPADAQQLTDARDGLLAAGVTRKSAETGAVQKRTTKQSAVTDGKTERAAARSILGGARRELHESIEADAVKAVGTLDAVLGETVRSGGSHAELGRQLSLLRDTLSNTVIAAACAARGGPAALTALSAAIGIVQGVPSATKHGTSEETERLDLFDGIIVELTRAARKASRVAARKTGSPALAAAFALVHLDGHPSHANAPVDPAPAPATR